MTSTPAPVRSSKLLRQVLLADGVTSGVTGLGLVVMPARIAGLVGAPSAALVTGIGAGLILFGAALVRHATRSLPERGATILIAALNLAWVAASAVVVVSGGLSPLGTWAVALVGIVVMGFAGLELRHLPPVHGNSLDAARA
jgi:hypothetical protein